MADIDAIQDCPHDESVGDGYGRWVCTECNGDQGEQDDALILSQLRACRDALAASEARRHDLVDEHARTCESQDRIRNRLTSERDGARARHG